MRRLYAHHFWAQHLVRLVNSGRIASVRFVEGFEALRHIKLARNWRKDVQCQHVHSSQPQHGRPTMLAGVSYALEAADQRLRNSMLRTNRFLADQCPSAASITKGSAVPLRCPLNSSACHRSEPELVEAVSEVRSFILAAGGTGGTA